MDLQARLKIDSRPEVNFEKDIRVFLKRFENSDLRLHPKIQYFYGEYLRSSPRGKDKSRKCKTLSVTRTPAPEQAQPSTLKRRKTTFPKKLYYQQYNLMKLYMNFSYLDQRNDKAEEKEEDKETQNKEAVE